MFGLNSFSTNFYRRPFLFFMLFIFFHLDNRIALIYRSFNGFETGQMKYGLSGGCLCPLHMSDSRSPHGVNATSKLCNWDQHAGYLGINCLQFRPKKKSLHWMETGKALFLATLALIHLWAGIFKFLEIQFHFN